MGGYIAPLVCLAQIGGCISDSSQSGSILGAANGLRAVVSAISPLGLAAWLTYYRHMPSIFAWPGSGFAVLAIIGLVACSVAAVEATREHWAVGTNHQRP